MTLSSGILKLRFAAVRWWWEKGKNERKKEIEKRTASEVNKVKLNCERRCTKRESACVVPKLNYRSEQAYTASKSRQLMQEHVVLEKRIKSSLRKLVMTTSDCKNLAESKKKRKSLEEIERQTWWHRENALTKLCLMGELNFLLWLSMRFPPNGN